MKPLAGVGAVIFLVGMIHTGMNLRGGDPTLFGSVARARPVLGVTLIVGAFVLAPVVYRLLSELALAVSPGTRSSSVTRASILSPRAGGGDREAPSARAGLPLEGDQREHQFLTQFRSEHPDLHARMGTDELLLMRDWLVGVLAVDSSLDELARSLMGDVEEDGPGPPGGEKVAEAWYVALAVVRVYRPDLLSQVEAVEARYGL